MHVLVFFFSSRRRHTRCALVTGVQTCALPICGKRRMRLVDLKAVALVEQPDVDALLRHRVEEIGEDKAGDAGAREHPHDLHREARDEIGSTSCRERVCQYVSISLFAVSLKKKIITYTATIREITRKTSK